MTGPNIGENLPFLAFIGPNCLGEDVEGEKESNGFRKEIFHLTVQLFRLINAGSQEVCCQ